MIRWCFFFMWSSLVSNDEGVLKLHWDFVAKNVYRMIVLEYIAGSFLEPKRCPVLLSRFDTAVRHICSKLFFFSIFLSSHFFFFWRGRGLSNRVALFIIHCIARHIDVLAFGPILTKRVCGVLMLVDNSLPIEGIGSFGIRTCNRKITHKGLIYPCQVFRMP